MAGKKDKKAPAFTLWLEFEHVQPNPGDDPEFDFFNMKVTLESGQAYALNVWTFKYFECVMQSTRSGQIDPRLGITWNQDLSNPLERQYLAPPDLLVTRCERKLIEDIISHLLTKWRGHLLPQWEVEPE